MTVKYTLCRQIRSSVMDVLSLSPVVIKAAAQCLLARCDRQYFVALIIKAFIHNYPLNIYKTLFSQINFWLGLQLNLYSYVTSHILLLIKTLKRYRTYQVL